MSVGRSMRDIEKQKVEKVSETGRISEQASRVEADISEVYKTIESLPGGLDQEISDQIEAARQAAQAEAGKDGDELEAAQEKTNGEFEKLCDMANSKIGDNKVATDKLKAIKAKYGKAEITGALSEIDANTELGQQVISESKKAMDAIEQKLRNMRDKIGNR